MCNLTLSLSFQLCAQADFDAGQHDHGDILADVFVTCSAKSQSPLNAWLGRSIVFSLGTWPPKSTDSELLSTTAKSLSIRCTMLTSVTKLAVASSSAVSSSTRNFVLSTNQFVKKSTWEELYLSMTIRLREKRTTRWRGVWLRVASLGHPRRALAALATAAAVAAAVWHGHQLIPSRFLLIWTALICLL